MPRRQILSTAIAALLIAPISFAENQYWNGTGTGWDVMTHWSLDPANPGPNPGAVPGLLDTAIFNITSVSAGQNVNLNGNQGVLGLSVVSTGSVTLRGGDADHSLLLGASGIEVAANAGTFTIGSATVGQQIDLVLLESQTWRNNSGNSSALVVHNDVVLGAPGAATLTLGGNTAVAVENAINGSIGDGAGTLGITMAPSSPNARWFLNGANTYGGVTTVSGGALYVRHSSALGATAGGTTVAAGGGLFLDNSVTVVGESLAITGSGPTAGPTPGPLDAGALRAIGGINRWTGDISVDTGIDTNGRIGAVNGSTLILDGNISATGTGQLVFQTGTDQVSGTPVIPATTGFIVVNGDISFPGQRLTKSVYGASSGTVILNGTNEYGNTTVSGGTLQIGNGGTTGTLGSGTIAISNTSSGTLALKRSDHLAIPNVISGNGTIAHVGTGTVTLSGANTHTGSTSITGGGMLTLDFSSLGSPTNLVGAGTLTLGGSKLHVIGQNAVTASQNFGTTRLIAGASLITADPNGGTVNVALGTFNRTVAGGTLAMASTPGISFTTTTTNGAGGMLGGYVIVGASDWATNDGTGKVVALNSYSNDLTGTGNLDVPAGGGSLTGAPNSVRFDDPGANTITLPADRVIATGGILVTPDVGANESRIQGAFRLSTGSGLDLVVFQNNTQGGLTIASNLGNSLTKSGEGLLTLTGGSVANIITRINAGTVAVSSPGPLGSGAGTGVIVFPTGSTGALRLTGNGTFSSAKGMTLTGNGRVEVPTLATFTGAQSVIGAGSFIKTGAGTLVFSSASNTNSYTGATIIEEGTLQVNTLANGGVNSGIGASTNDAANFVLNGGALKYTGATPADTDRLFTIGAEGATLDGSGGAGANVRFTNIGSIGLSGTDLARTFVLAGINTDGNVLAPVLGDNGLGATSLEKTGAGSWTLAGLNTYSGGTVVSGGTLLAGANSAFGTGDVTVNTSAVSLTISSGFTDTVANTATLSLAGDGLLDNVAVSGFAFLAGGVNEAIGGLVLGGIAQTGFGTYGATGSGATFIFDDYFQGPGVVTLVPEPSAAIAILSGLGVLVGCQRFRRGRNRGI